MSPPILWMTILLRFCCGVVAPFADEFGDDAMWRHTLHTGLKELNSWPTFPQLIVNGEFVGGLDIVQEMVENGELKEMLSQ